ESYSLSHAEVDRIVGDFNKKSNRKMLEAVEKYKKGETLSEENQSMMNVLNSFVFNLKLVNDELIEKFSTHAAEQIDMARFVEFVIENSGFEKNVVEREVDRLFKLGCLSSSI